MSSEHHTTDQLLERNGHQASCSIDSTSKATSTFGCATVEVFDEISKEDKAREAKLRRTIQNRLAQRAFRQRRNKRIEELRAQIASLSAPVPVAADLAIPKCDNVLSTTYGTEQQTSAFMEAKERIRQLEERIRDLEEENGRLKAATLTDLRSKTQDSSTKSNFSQAYLPYNYYPSWHPLPYTVYGPTPTALPPSPVTAIPQQKPPFDIPQGIMHGHTRPYFPSLVERTSMDMMAEEQS